MNWVPWPTDGNALRPGYPIPPPGYFPYYHPGMLPHPHYAPPQVQPTPNGHPTEAQNAEVSQISTVTQPAAPVIDPSLESSLAAPPSKPTSSGPAGAAGANVSGTAQQELDAATTQLQITHAAMQAVFDAARRHQEKLDAEKAEEQALELLHTVAATSAAEAATRQASLPPSPQPTVAPKQVEPPSFITQEPAPSTAVVNGTALPTSDDTGVPDETPSVPTVVTATPIAEVGQILAEDQSTDEKVSS